MPRPAKARRALEDDEVAAVVAFDEVNGSALHWTSVSVGWQWLLQSHHARDAGADDDNSRIGVALVPHGDFGVGLVACHCGGNVDGVR